MYNMIGIGLLCLFALLAVPIVQGTSTNTPYYGGYATMVVYDIEGDEKFAQQVHNRINNDGERFIVDQVFADGTASVADANAVGKICAYQHGTDFSGVTETTAAAAFDSANQNGAANKCKEDTSVTDGGTGTAVVGGSAGLAFAVAGNLDAGETIRGIGVCTIGTSNTASCAGTGSILFASIDTGDVTVNTGDTVNINYTFDISDSSN